MLFPVIRVIDVLTSVTPSYMITLGNTVKLNKYGTLFPCYLYFTFSELHVDSRKPIKITKALSEAQHNSENVVMEQIYFSCMTTIYQTLQQLKLYRTYPFAL